MEAISTARIVLEMATDANCGQSAVDWAVRMLELGHDTPHLRMLAAQSGPYYHFEMKQLCGMALSELQVDVPTASEAVIPFTCERLKAALSGAEDLPQVMEELMRVCVDLGYDDELYEFYLLHFAWDDLRDSTYSPHLDHATRERIDGLMRAAAEEFLRRHHSLDSCAP